MNQGVTFISDLNEKRVVNQSIEDFLINEEQEPLDQTAPTATVTDEQIYDYLTKLTNSEHNRHYYYEDTCDEGDYHMLKCNKCRHRMCGRDYSFNSNMILYVIIAILTLLVIILLCKK